MLFISSDKSNKNCLFINLLVKNLQLEKFKDIQIVSVNEMTQKALNLENIPMYISNEGTKIMSLQEISRVLTNLMGLSPLLLGQNKNEESSSLKWMELDYNLE
jgi:hypothetical protein